MPRKERVLKQKKTALKRAAEDQGQTKLAFFKAPRNDLDSSGKEKSISVTDSLGECSVDFLFNTSFRLQIFCTKMNVAFENT